MARTLELLLNHYQQLLELKKSLEQWEQKYRGGFMELISSLVFLLMRPTGQSSIPDSAKQIRRTASPFSIEINLARVPAIKDKRNCYPRGWIGFSDSVTQEVVVTSAYLSRNGKRLEVTEIFSDLLNPTEAKLIIQQGVPVLLMRIGSDGEGYRVRIEIRPKELRRRVWNNTDAGIPFEEISVTRIVRRHPKDSDPIPSLPKL